MSEDPVSGFSLNPGIPDITDTHWPPTPMLQNLADTSFAKYSVLRLDKGHLFNLTLSSRHTYYTTARQPV